MTTKIIIIRHGKAENPNKIWVGQRDIDLSKQGIEEAKRLGSFLKDNYNVDLIISSDLKRAYKTAEIISKMLNAKVIKIKDFREMNHGDVDGLTEEEFITKYPQILEAWEKDIDIRFPKGENMEDLEKRVLPKFLELIEKSNDKTILFVLHKTVILCIIGWFFKTPYTHRHRLKINNCSITEIEYKNRRNYKIIKLNDTCHFKPFKTSL